MGRGFRLMRPNSLIDQKAGSLVVAAPSEVGLWRRSIKISRALVERTMVNLMVTSSTKVGAGIIWALYILTWASFLPHPLRAQNTLPLRGQVVDEQGAVIPGARVILTARDGKERKVSTGADGGFLLLNIRAGAYNLTIVSRGFRTFVDDNLSVPQIGDPLRIIMVIAPVSVESEVKSESDSVSTDPDQNSNSIVLSGDFIKNLPENEDDLRDFLQALAGPGGQGGAQILVDGFGGERIPPREAILQIRINRNPFSAEFDRPGIGRIEIITKPGYDQWHGGAGFGFHHSALDARNAFAQVKPNFVQRRYSFNVGGPLVHKKLSFGIFADSYQVDGDNTALAITPEGQLSANVPTATENLFWGLRADYLLNVKNSLNVSYNRWAGRITNREFASGFSVGIYFRGSLIGVGNGLSGFGAGCLPGGGYNLLPERGSDCDNSNHTLRLAETWVLSSQVVHESRFQYQREHTQLRAKNDGVAINVLDSFGGGGSTCCPSDLLGNGVEYQDYLTYNRKKHTIKGGWQFRYENIRDLSAANFNGTYTFSNLDQYVNALNAKSGAQARAAQFTINRGDPLVKFGNYVAAWFAQDDFRVRPNLTLSMGLRHEVQSHVDDKVNFAPRLGLAWSPLKSRGTVFRAGGGVFYNRLSANLYGYTRRFDGMRQQSFVVRDAPFPDPFIGDSNVEARNIKKYALAPDLRAPYTLSFNAVVERQLPYGLIASLTFARNKSVHLYRTRVVNAPLSGDDGRSYTTANNYYLIESSAKSEFDGLIFRLNRMLSRRLAFFSSYTLSRARDNVDGPLSLPADSNDLQAEWGRASSDRRHSFFLGGFVNLPHGLRLNASINASSGAPFNITTGRDDNGDLALSDRPPGVGRNADLPSKFYPSLPDALICKPGTTPTFSPAERRLLCNPGGEPQAQLRDFLAAQFPNGVQAIGPGSFNVNTSFSKTFHLGKGAGPKNQDMSAGMAPAGAGGESSHYSLDVSVNVMNLFNRVNFGQYGGVLGTPYFGRPSSASPARQLNFDFRFNF
jgi:hypothetical protein